MTKILNVLALSDLHGNYPNFHFSKKEFDCIVLVGDICSDNFDAFNKKKKISKRQVEKLRKISYKSGRDILEKLNKIKKPIFIIPGNWDNPIILDGVRKEKNKKRNYFDMIEGLENVKNIFYKKVKFKGVNFLGTGATSGLEPINFLDRDNFDNFDDFYEYNLRVKYFRKVILKMSSLFDKLKNKPNVYVSHVPPFETKLDLIRNKKVSKKSFHFGSIIAKYLVKNYKPALLLCGHVHEAIGTINIGKTKCINTGRGADNNFLIKIDIQKSKVIKIIQKGENQL